MSSVNVVILVGRLGKDPEGRQMQNGGQVVTFSLATSEAWKDKATGERREKTEWHTVVIFNEGLAKVALAYLKKGSQVYISGSLQTRKWTDKNGADRYTTEVVLQKYRGELVLLDKKSDAGQDGAENALKGGGDIEDSIPFAACKD